MWSGTTVVDLTPEQVALLEQLVAQGFQVVAFPLYASAVGVRKGNCAALLVPAEGGRFRLLGEPSYLLEGNLSVRVNREGRKWFVWKKKQLEVTLERQAELERFVEGLTQALGVRT
ncbi:MAG TPA: hypothetical protein VKE24_15155 [Candidatus Acidoferrales bacterium]|nr:hypothetical protein [Candidatus Acidoferrales bacterium]